VIDFRYHLVSIISVFLALAVGLLVGSTYLSGVNEAALGSLQTSLTNTNAALRAKNAALTKQINADRAFAQASSQQLLAPGGSGLLAGRKVVLVEAGGSSQLTDGVKASLQQAGATVTGEVQLQPQFFDGSGQTESSLTQLAQQLASQAGVTKPTSVPFPAVAGQQYAAAVIAASIVTRSGTGLAGSADQAILSGFAQGGFLQVTNLVQPGASTLSPATLAIVLTPAGTAPQQATSQALVAVAAQLQSASLGTVMAGSQDSSAAGSAISLESGPNQVSTVDNADTASGQIMVAQALRLLLDGKAPAGYGVGPGTAPSPAPTPAATSAAATPTPTVKGKSP
jgi:hypothetical protein